MLDGLQIAEGVGRGELGRGRVKGGGVGRHIKGNNSFRLEKHQIFFVDKFRCGKRLKSSNIRNSGRGKDVTYF